MLFVLYNHQGCLFLQLKRTALHIAARAGHYNVVTSLIRYGADVKDVDRVS